jgi:hypothetical protein
MPKLDSCKKSTLPNESETYDHVIKNESALFCANIATLIMRRKV